MFSLMIGTEVAPIDYRGYATTDFTLYEEICAVLMQRGIFLDDDREPWFLSYSHDSNVVAETLTLVRGVTEVIQHHQPHQAFP
ncbi:MAG: hypothetical protein R2932_40990 [Caldilineaceae bacterium]